VPRQLTSEFSPTVVLHVLSAVHDVLHSAPQAPVHVVFIAHFVVHPLPQEMSQVFSRSQLKATSLGT
jgi:hypothetical protein